MTEGFSSLVDELGEEVFGVAWLHLRGPVIRWIESNPERVAWICHRLRRMMTEGRL